MRSNDGPPRELLRGRSEEARKIVTDRTADVVAMTKLWAASGEDGAARLRLALRKLELAEEFLGRVLAADAPVNHQEARHA